MLPWSLAEEQLKASHDYGLATVWANGRRPGHCPASPEASEERANVFQHQPRFLGGREVPTPRHDGPARHVRLALHEPPRDAQQLPREHGHGRGRLDRRYTVVHERPWPTERLRVE